MRSPCLEISQIFILVQNVMLIQNVDVDFTGTVGATEMLPSYQDSTSGHYGYVCQISGLSIQCQTLSSLKCQPADGVGHKVC